MNSNEPFRQGLHDSGDSTQRTASAASSTEIIFDNLSGSYNGVSYVSTTSGRAARFITDSHAYQLNSFTLGLGNQSPYSDSGTLELRLFSSSDGGAEPLVDLNAAFTTPFVTAPPYQDTNVTFTPGSQITLEAHTTYWAVLRELDGDGGIGWTGSFTSPTGAAAAYGRASYDGGGPWSSVDGISNFKMQIEAIPVPEPATWVLFLGMFVVLIGKARESGARSSSSTACAASLLGVVPEASGFARLSAGAVISSRASFSALRPRGAIQLAMAIGVLAVLSTSASAQIQIGTPVTSYLGGGFLDANDDVQNGGFSFIDLEANGTNSGGKVDLHLTGDWSLPFPRIDNIHGLVDTDARLPFTVGHLPVEIDNFQLVSNAKWVLGGGERDSESISPGAGASVLFMLTDGGGYLTKGGSWASSTLYGNGYNIEPLTTTLVPGAYVLAPDAVYTLACLVETGFGQGVLGNAPSITLTNEFGGALEDSFNGFDVVFTWHTVPEPSGLVIAVIGAMGLAAVVLRRRYARRASIAAVPASRTGLRRSRSLKSWFDLAAG